MKFTIIVPVYNVENYIRQCLDSLLAQTFEDWECISINDGSTDASGAILEEYTRRDLRFRVVHQSNCGVSAARNVGLDQAKGEWITFLDADDCCSKSYLAEAQHLIEKEHPDLLKMGWSCFFEDDNAIFEGEEEVSREYEIYVQKDSVKKVVMNLAVTDRAAWSLFQPAVDARNFRFPVGVSYCEDGVRLLQLGSSVRKICISHYKGYQYRNRSNSSRAQRLPAKERLAFFNASGVMDYGRCANMGHYLWENLLAWEKWHTEEDFCRDGEIRSAYMSAARKLGVNVWNIKLHWRIPYLLYLYFGIRWPIHFVRKLTRSLKSSWI